MAFARLLLRLVAVLGPLAVIGWQVVSLPPFEFGQEGGFGVLLFEETAVVIFMLAAMPRAIRRIVHSPDLLVPLGVSVALGGAIRWLGSRPGLTVLATPLWSGSVLGLPLAVSTSLILTILLSVVYAGWTTSLIVQAVERGRVELLAPLASLRRWFLRTLAALSVGIVGWMLLTAIGIAVARVMLPLSMILMGLMSLVWNLNTAALLPAALRSRGSISSSLHEGFRVSRRGMGRWWGVVILQMILLGWVTFLFSGGGKSVNVFSFWTGGYDDSCRWYEQAAKFSHTQLLPLVVTLLGLLFGVVAVAVKLTVTERMEWQTEDGEKVFPVELGAMPRARPPIVVGVVGVILLATFLALINYEKLSENVFVWQFRRAAERGESPQVLVSRILEREDKLIVAERLSEDADPRVRRGVAGALADGATVARKRERPFGSGGDSWSEFYPRSMPLLTRLLNDSDSDVRLETIRAIADKRAVEKFRQPLLVVFHSGELPERIAVAESLAHWEPSTFLQTFADRQQPKEIRLALLRGAERFGWGRVAESPQFQETMAKSLDDPVPELRRAAIAALRHTTDASSPWLVVLQKGDADDRRLAFQIWVETLVGEPLLWGVDDLLLQGAENLLVQVQHGGKLVEKPRAGGGAGELDSARIALVLHVLVTAARAATEQLDRASPANLALANPQRAQGGGSNAQRFDHEKHWLQLILRTLAAVRRVSADPRSGKIAFFSRMPDEPPAPAAARKLREFLLTDVKELLDWCRRHRDGYASTSLRVNGFCFSDQDEGGRQPGMSRTLGQVLEAMHLHSDAALIEYIKAQAKK